MYVFAIVQADAQADARRRSAHSLEFEAPPWRRRGFRAAKCKAAAAEATTSHCSNLRPDSAVHTDMLCSFLFVLFAIRE